MTENGISLIVLLGRDLNFYRQLAHKASVCRFKASLTFMTADTFGLLETDTLGIPGECTGGPTIPHGTIFAPRAVVRMKLR